MRTFILMFYINLMIGCYTKNLGPQGDVVGNGGDGITGYWKLSKYEVRGKSASLLDASEKQFLVTKSGYMDHDSARVYFYRKGIDYRVFSFYDAAIDSTDRYLGVLYNYDYSKKTKQSAFYYRMNETIGFLAVIDRDISAGITTKLKLSNIMKSATYKPELDSLRYTYEPTEKFR
ncbi:hypothetical protein L0663_02765 [Dyadobacter sp. CY107]|uniref:hypothetical protein n=1 Tax=Dyadobacter fanqingshengii TaxID=2906443 RepID=UPI001F326C7B|nr:hypothetical protein [Dyadobacter fanqingshengii]MCF2502286.1 hypothetical protein [Dyadobacter fanqingshengii]